MGRYIDTRTRKVSPLYEKRNRPGPTVFKDDKGNWGFTAFGRTFLSSSRYVTKYRAMQNCEKLIRSELKSLLDELTPTENVSIDDEENPYLSTIEKLKSMFHM